jgi:hypothetical protein
VDGLTALLVFILVIGERPQDPPPGTRAAELDGQREAKSRELKPPRRSRVERLLFKIEDDLVVERWLNPPRGFYLRLGGIGEGSGFGIGPGYRYSTGAFDMRVSAAGSMLGYAIGEASLLLPGRVKNGGFVELYARRRDFPQEDFFGLGPLSRVDERTNFALRDTLVRATAGARRGGFAAGVAGGYLDPSIGAGTDTRMPSTDAVFSPLDVPGLGEQTAFTLIEPFVEWSNADPPLNPLSGATVRSSLARYSDSDRDRYSFQRFDVDARAYLPLFQRTHTIALRTWISEARPESGHQVPFYLQPTLGGSYSLRGFRTFRFRDRSVALVQAEYRWRINELVTGALFFDTGAVAPRLGDLGTLERDYGFGLRAGGRNGVVFRADVALGSGEGARILVRFNNVF